MRVRIKAKHMPDNAYACGLEKSLTDLQRPDNSLSLLQSVTNLSSQSNVAKPYELFHVQRQSRCACLHVKDLFQPQATSMSDDTAVYLTSKVL